MDRKQLRKIREFSKPFYKKSGKYHGWDHILAVRKHALKLARKYPKVDTSILEAACYLHDIGRSVKDKGHEGESAKLSLTFLKKIGLRKEETKEIRHAVVSHVRENVLSARTLEAKLLFDADKLEILSVYGFFRVWFWLIDERKMKMDKALEFLWGWSKEVQKDYLQTKEAKRIVKGEMKLLEQIVFRFESWKRVSID